MNQKFYSVFVAGAAAKADTIAVNLYQLMTIPCSYQPLDMFEITADLYSLFIVSYDVRMLFDDSVPSTVHDPSRRQAVQEVNMSTYQR